ncbi:phosphoribosylglycinamide formyltransferase [Lottiidibacillus patelloidae]|uniref:Phosphoribosylglycinamide formyltransferase n=1 Tax=Lottiidibacillus patelloidae TaxID=2670334 RepID=A0A263BRM7_9BACI|nr:phosphoribosylglycinamide formyltransferase [Lottiidibacillus patelloidae]OZM56232.1 phosphoribosylglycinamide formyltransferase [Lottiidibacillus patelloidae]
MNNGQKRKIAVFASGNGSNFQALLDAQDQSNYEIVLLVCDNKEAKVMERATFANIPIFCFAAKDYNSKEDYEKVIVKQLHRFEVEFIALAGYMRIIGKTMLDIYEGKIINIHPSLLPAFQGKDAIEQALAKGVCITGVTIHFIDEGIDTGPIIAQEVVKISLGETKETLRRKINNIETVLYPKVIHTICAIGEKERVIEWQSNVH